LAANEEPGVGEGPNWEAALLEQALSRRVQAAGTFYWSAGAAQPPVPPIALTGGIPDPVTLPYDDLAEAARTYWAKAAWRCNTAARRASWA
jgi:hypothetical protein